MSTHSWILRALGADGWLVVVLCVLQGLAAVNAVAFALVMRQAIDSAVAGDGPGFWWTSALFGGLLALQVLLRAANRFFDERTHALLDNRLRQRAFHSVLEQGYRTASAHHTGEFMSRMTSDVGVVSDGVAVFVPNTVSMVVRLVGAFGALCVLAPGLAAMFAIAGVVLAVAAIPLRGRLRRLHRQVQEAESTVRCFLQECLESLVVVHSFGCETKVEGVNDHNQTAHRRARMRKSNVSNVCSSGLSLALQCGYLLGFVWCGMGILQGTVTYGTMMAIIQLVGQIQSPFANLGGTFSKYSAMLASADRLRELEELGADAGVCACAGAGVCAPGAAGAVASQPTAVSGAVVTQPAPASVVACTPAFPREGFEAFGLDKVSFGYDSNEGVLDHCSFEVRAGEFVGMAGPSGSGKSTTMMLIMGIYQPDEGSAYVRFSSGVCEASALPAGLFAYVPQGNHLLSGTVRDVVGFAERGPHIDDGRVRRACEAACAAGFIERMPKGYHSVLGEHGTGLSEGQMQRLAIARALYSDAPVVLLDEATSALDSATEQRLLENLRNAGGRTFLMTTHREHALQACSRVIALKEDAHESARV